MSGIYIPMEMPTIEMEWTIRHGADGKWYAIDTNAETSDGEWHEIVPVPPHGDLIDRDALPWEKQGKILTDPDEWGIDARYIEAAPTIILADPAKKEEK